MIGIEGYIEIIPLTRKLDPVYALFKLIRRGENLVWQYRTMGWRLPKNTIHITSIHALDSWELDKLIDITYYVYEGRDCQSIPFEEHHISRVWCRND